MTDEDRKMLRETHDAVLTIRGMVADHHTTLFGNGRIGLKDRVTILEQGQENCPARSAYTRNATEAKRALWVALAGVAVALLAVLLQVRQ
jgi:hypothetical protein